MAAKTFGGKKIAIRRITTADLKHAKKFQVFINALIREEAKILMAKEVTLKEEKEFLKKVLAGAKERTKIYFAAECDGEIVATTSIELDRLRKNHIGLGTYLMSEIIKAAKKELRPTPKMIQLDVYTDNKPAIGLYKKMGFRRVARIPKQVQYKGKLVDEFVMQLYLK